MTAHSRMASDEDQYPITGLVITRSQCSCKKHYTLEDANEMNIWHDLGLKQPKLIPKDLSSAYQPSDQLQDQMASIEEPHAEEHASKTHPLAGNKKLIGIPGQEIGMDQESFNQHPPLDGPVKNQVQHRKKSDEDSGIDWTSSSKREISSASSEQGVLRKMKNKLKEVFSDRQDSPTHSKRKIEPMVTDDQSVVNDGLFELEKSVSDREVYSPLAPGVPQSSREEMLDASLSSCSSGEGVRHHTLKMTIQHQLLHNHGGRTFVQEIVEVKELVLDEHQKDNPRNKRIFERFKSEDKRAFSDEAKF